MELNTRALKQGLRVEFRPQLSQSDPGVISNRNEERTLFFVLQEDSQAEFKRRNVACFRVIEVMLAAGLLHAALVGGVEGVVDDNYHDVAVHFGIGLEGMLQVNDMIEIQGPCASSLRGVRQVAQGILDIKRAEIRVVLPRQHECRGFTEAIVVLHRAHLLVECEPPALLRTCGH